MASISVGLNNLKKALVGDKEVQSIWMGSTQIYSSTSQLATPAISLSGDTLTITEVANAESYGLYVDGTKEATVTPGPAYCKISIQAHDMSSNYTQFGGSLSINGVSYGSSTGVFESDTILKGSILNISYYDSTSGWTLNPTVYVDGVIVASDEGMSVNLSYNYTITSDILIEVSSECVYITTNASITRDIKTVYLNCSAGGTSQYVGVIVNGILISNSSTVTGHEFYTCTYNWSQSSWTHTIYVKDTSQTTVYSASETAPAKSSWTKKVNVTQYVQNNYSIIA